MASLKKIIKQPKKTENVNLVTENTLITPSIEIEHVRKVYDTIAKQWNSTRYKSWPIVADFCKIHCNHGKIVADIGCGNGKMASDICNDGAFAIACDTSHELIKICNKHNKKKYECLIADGIKLPYRSNTFDVALNIAVLHHLSTKERRIKCISETLRILKPNGVALFYVWAKEQNNSKSNFIFNSSDVFVPFHLRQHGPDYNKEIDNNYPKHAIKDTTKKAMILKRYCHVFDNGELESIIKPLAQINESYYDSGNYGVYCTKLG